MITSNQIPPSFALYDQDVKKTIRGTELEILMDNEKNDLSKLQRSLDSEDMESLKELVGESPLVIFSSSSCCMSHSVKQLIVSYGANATVYELDQIHNGQEIDKALKKIGCKPSVPAVFIGQGFVGGAKEVFSLQLQGKLMPILKEAGAIWV
ncbi:hypothetical protein V2J09_016117 [Rumex salicifolius]